MAIIMDVWNIIIQTDVEPLCRKILCVHFTTIFPNHMAICLLNYDHYFYPIDCLLKYH